MNCPEYRFPEGADFFRALFRRAEQERVPVAGSLELTRRCELACVHCYLGYERGKPRARREMTTEEVLRILDQAIAAGCLGLLITGGDPLLRSDFATVYRRAKLAGVDVTVFTSGTRVTEEHCELFRDLPPRVVEITLYGATAETFERITQVPGSYRRCLTGVERLLGAGVRVGLKTMLMTLNQHELGEMRTMAQSLGVKFRFDGLLNACLDASKGPLEWRLDAAEVARAEFDDPQVCQNWLGFARRHPSIPTNERVLQCGAGETQFHVDSYGRLQPCLMLPRFSYDLLDGDWVEGWRRLAAVRELRLDAASPCGTCTDRAYCGYCAGLVELETGCTAIPSSYLCSLAKERTQVLAELLREDA